MPPFTPIHAQLQPLSQSSAATISVFVLFETWLSDDRRISGFIGESLTLPYFPPGSSFTNPIDVEALRITDNGIFYHDLQRPGDSIENPIDVDAVSVATNHAAEIIARRSPSRAQTRHISDGRSLETRYECKICYHDVVDLALGCGHTYCYNCFNKFFHDFVLAEAGGSQASAHKHLARRRRTPFCPYCKEMLPGHYTDPEDRDHLKGFYFPLRCPDPESSHCFIDDYMVQGVRLKML